MIKLLKRFRPVDWILTALILGLTVAQVWFDLELPTYSANIISEITNEGATVGSVLSIGGTMLLLALGSMACSMAIGFIAAYVSAHFSYSLRGDVYRKVVSFSFEEINRFSTPSLITRSTNDIQQVQMAVVMILRMAISAPITAIWAIFRIQATSATLTAATAVALCVLVAVLITIFVIVMPKFKLIQRLTDRLNGVTRENLTGLRVVRAYNAEQYQEEKFGKVNEEVTRVNLFTNRVMGLMSPFMMLVMNGITLAIYWLGASLINEGSLDFATMTAFSMLAMQVLMAFMMLTMLFIMLPRASVSAKRINEVLETENRIGEPAEPKPFTERATVEMKNVSFRYPDADGYVLKDISFRAKQGDTVAFIGATGSGKSTLVNLIPRFYDATEGEVLVDGVNVREVRQADLRARIGYVPQKGTLFSGTVASNIGYGGVTDDQKIRSAAEVAMASEFVEQMEEGYDSHISQGGKNVSGGQKQRLSIARAAAIDPEIFIFDDSFSALDYKTDREVRSRLKEYTKNATSLIVAQRIGTIRDADLIIVLDRGVAVGQGTHEELLKTCPVYREIALSQLSKEELGL
ncbi:MAG: ABC transporter ATP-binding protein [Clostridia bacterium]|nr:ABC transporter ATP-binding protein [Clostridia bacterium]